MKNRVGPSMKSVEIVCLGNRLVVEEVPAFICPFASTVGPHLPLPRLEKENGVDREKRKMVG